MSKFRFRSGPTADRAAYCPTVEEIYALAAEIRARRPRPQYVPYGGVPPIVEREIRMNDYVRKERYEE